MAAKKTSPTVATAAENRGLRNSRTSSDGNATLRSTSTNATSTAMPAIRLPHACGRPKPWSPPLMMP